MNEIPLKNGLIALIAILIFSGCHQENPYGPDPVIDFTKVYVFDTTDALGNKTKLYDIFFKIVDGDYDFGLKEGDTTGIFSPDSTYYNNLFITYWVYSDGQWQILDIPSNNYRIPYVPPEGLNPYFKAEIDIKLEIQTAFLEPYADSIYFSFYVVDKALHKSNEQRTPAMSLDFAGALIDTVVVISDD